MSHLRRAIQHSRQVYWLQALPLDTHDACRHFSTRHAAQRAITWTGEYELRRVRPGTMRRLAARHNARVRAFRSR